MGRPSLVGQWGSRPRTRDGRSSSSCPWETGTGTASPPSLLRLWVSPSVLRGSTISEKISAEMSFFPRSNLRPLLGLLGVRGVASAAPSLPSSLPSGDVKKESVRGRSLTSERKSGVVRRACSGRRAGRGSLLARAGRSGRPRRRRTCRRRTCRRRTCRRR